MESGLGAINHGMIKTEPPISDDSTAHGSPYSVKIEFEDTIFPGIDTEINITDEEQNRIEQRSKLKRMNPRNTDEDEEPERLHRRSSYKSNRLLDMDRLISAVQSKPVLWDKSAEKYKDKYKTQEAWREVCVEIFDEYDELHDTERNELGKYVLKKWTQVRDSYRKSIDKTKMKGASKTKAYIYASQMQFLDKVFAERETDYTSPPTLNDDIGGVEDETVENHEDSFKSVPNVTSEKSFRKKASKRKIDAVEVEMIATLKETPNRHLSFLKGLLPSLEDFDEFDTLDFQMGVLKVVKKIRLRKFALTSASDRTYPSPSSSSSMGSPSSSL